MKRSGIWAFVVLSIGAGASYGFDVQKYVHDHNDLHDFTRDVNEAKREMLEGKLSGWETLGREANAIGEIFRDMLFRPPCDKVRVVASVVPILYHDAATLSEAKRQVLEEMMTREVVRELEKYGISVVDNATAPVLRTQVCLKNTKVDSQVVYAMNVNVELGEALTDAANHLKVWAVTWNRSNLMTVDSERDIEELMLKTARFRLDDFVREQYERCVLREAKSQLERAGKLPLWLKIGLAERSKEISSRE